MTKNYMTEDVIHVAHPSASVLKMPVQLYGFNEMTFLWQTTSHLYNITESELWWMALTIALEWAGVEEEI